MCLYVCLGVVVVLGWESHGVNQKLESQAWEHPGVTGTLERSATGSAETAFSGNSQSGQYQDSTPMAPKEIPPTIPYPCITQGSEVPNSVPLIKLESADSEQISPLGCF